MADPDNRRPLKSRGTGWAQATTGKLAAANITPNQISAASVVCAALAGLCFAGVAWGDGGLRIVFLLAGAVFVQMRLLCNLFDGMVAVEAGRGSATGAFWNEVPDRPADVLILVGVGVGADAAWLGWAAAALAVFIAYLRAFGGSLNQEADYRGPMAKQHRMAAVTAGAVGATALSAWGTPPVILWLTLWVIVIGEIATAVRRMARIRALLATSEDPD